MDKRQATLQICLRACCPEGLKQPRLALIFRGTGARITALEKAQWDQRVDVYFQEKAWFDRKTALAWLAKTWSAHIEEDNRIRGLKQQQAFFQTAIQTNTTDEETPESEPESTDESSDDDSMHGEDETSVNQAQVQYEPMMIQVLTQLGT